VPPQAQGEADNARGGSAKLQAELSAAQASLRAQQQEVTRLGAELAASSSSASGAAAEVARLQAQLDAGRRREVELEQQLAGVRRSCAGTAHAPTVCPQCALVRCRRSVRLV
jgi:predicted  nucleic acid-binding Zn-ribbon protein